MLQRTPPVLGLLAVLAASFAFGVSAASAAPQLSGTFPLSGEPQHVARGSDGNVWIPLTGSTATPDPTELARIKPDGTVDEFQLKGDPNDSEGIVTGPDGKLWITAGNKVLRVDPANPAVLNQQDFPVVIGQAQAIVTGPDGNLWTA